MNVIQLARTGELAASLARTGVAVGPRPSELTHGFHADYPDALYHTRELGVASKGAVDRVLRSAAHYESWLAGDDDEEDEPSPAFHLGKAAHRAILEPARFQEEYVIAPDFGPTRKSDDHNVSTEQGRENKIRKAAWYAEHRGATILDSASGKNTLGMVRAIAEHRYARPLLEQGLPELTLVWRHPETGLVCKARADHYRPDAAIGVDVKSCLDARAKAFQRSVETFFYDRQEAHYRDGFEALGYPLDAFLFIAVEKRRPHGIQIYDLAPSSVAVARKQIRFGLGRMAECAASHVFPSYPETIQTLTLSPWARKERLLLP